MVINPNTISNQQLEKLSRISSLVFKWSENELRPPNIKKTWSKLLGSLS